MVCRLIPMGKPKAMITTLPVNFLREKIRTIQSALFVTDTDVLVKLPTHVVQVADMDDSGHIWFVIPRPVHNIEAFEKEIPAKLDFFKKGQGCYLKVTGVATLVEDDSAIRKTTLFKQFEGRFDSMNIVAIRIRIKAAHYYDSSLKPSSNWVLNAGNHLFNWLMNPLYNEKQPELITVPIYTNS
jgi:general stress protein 26